ncbi:hypothetical protein NE237_030690 [Protea cynaroides]|uniref:Endonuclease/exonuclease/phosphatase domain-containing protein n=1 Tax=Protea cynaroides TaxID=273540 RepID=A0A9Q0GWF7_9MAGN|nr:hypothetical protein NE237_030690 [Protea cynaroides]
MLEEHNLKNALDSNGDFKLVYHINGEKYDSIWYNAAQRWNFLLRRKRGLVMDSKASNISKLRSTERGLSIGGCRCWFQNEILANDGNSKYKYKRLSSEAVSLSFEVEALFFIPQRHIHALMLKSFLLLPRLSAYPVRRICMSKMSSPKLPICPKFKSLENGENDIRVNSDGFRFRVVSYNILAQVYVKSSYFPHSPSPCLKWKARSQAILTILRSLEADFLCIQELDEYDSFYKSNLESLGYSGIYVQRSGQKRDGCGIFHKCNSAELVLEEKIEYNDLVDSVEIGTTGGMDRISDSTFDGNEEVAHTEDSPPKNESSDTVDPNDPRVRMKRDCVGLMAAFKLRDHSNHLVIVANTHIYWDPEWIDVKLAQAKYLLFRLAQFKEVVSNKFDCTPSVILAGDFNSTPGDMVYQFLISGNSSAMPVPEHSEAAPIPLCSVYAFIGREPPFTNCTPDFTNTLDYIFFSPSGGLRPVSFLELPGPESSDVIGGLPNFHHPSDHLPIGTDFEIIGT